MPDSETETQVGTTGDATGSPGTGSTGNGGSEPTFTKTQVESLIEDRLRRDRETRERQAAKTAEAADADRLKEQQRFAELADQRQARITELEPQAEQAARYEAALRTHLDAQRQDLPAHLVELLDAVGDPVRQLDWISAHRDELHKANGTAGVPATPRAAGPQTTGEREAHYRERLASTGTYDHL